MKTIFITLSILLTTHGHGQCALSLGYSSSPGSCQAESCVELYIYGGTPPFSISHWFDGVLASSYSNEYYEHCDYYSTGGEYTVTDADGCSASISTSSYTAYPLEPYVSIVYDGNGSPGLRFTVEEPFCDIDPILTLQGPMDLAVSLQDMLQPGGLIIWELPLGSYTYNNEQVFICDDFWLHCVYMVGNKYLMNLNDTGVNIRINAALAGPMQTDGLMSDALRSEGLIPLVEPFSALGYSYINAPSGLMTTLNVLAGTGEQAPVDWVIVEMRSIDFPDVIIASRPALITRNGDIIDRDGDPYVNFPGIAPGNYRLAIRHRNHLGVLSGGTHYMTQEPWQLIDFSATGGIPLYGGSASTTVVGGKRCLWPGDVNFSGVVNYTGPNNDRDMILQALGGISPTATINGAYHSCDVNMNGIVSYTGPANDRDIILQTIGGTVPTHVRVEQVP